MLRITLAAALILCVLSARPVAAGPIGYSASAEATIYAPEGVEIGPNGNGVLYDPGVQYGGLLLGAEASVKYKHSSATAIVENNKIKLNAEAGAGFSASASGEFADYIALDAKVSDDFLTFVYGFSFRITGNSFGRAGAVFGWQAIDPTTGNTLGREEMTFQGAIDEDVFRIVKPPADGIHNVNIHVGAFVYAVDLANAHFDKTFELVRIQVLLPDGTPHPTAVVRSASGIDYSGRSQVVPTVAIPEPSTLALLGLGVLGLAARARRRAASR